MTLYPLDTMSYGDDRAITGYHCIGVEQATQLANDLIANRLRQRLATLLVEVQNFGAMMIVSTRAVGG